MPVLIVLLFVSLAIFAETGQSAGQARPDAGTATGQFDPRDLSGIWLRRGGDRGLSPNAPPMTPEGVARFKQNYPARSRSDLVKAADIPSDSNDPTMDCNPQGFPRILLDTAHDYHENIQSPGRILQFWQKERRPREIWVDGRALPSGSNLDDLGPTWYGHSVGVWQGDTLVVNTVGLDDRAWLDMFGHPKSVEARIEERYRKVDAITVELQMTLFDPKFYTAPWVSDTKIFKKQTRDEATFFGWYGLFSGVGELICAPMNANRVNKRGG
jgi:hypothetical protein